MVVPQHQYTHISHSKSVIFLDLILKTITQIPNDKVELISGSLQTHKTHLFTL